MTRFVIVITLALTVLLSVAFTVEMGLAQTIGEPTATRPNILVVMTDDLDNSLMEYMPETRRLVGDQGMTFSRFFVSLSLCCPSRATFLTGRYAHNHGVITNEPGGHALFEPHERQTLVTELQRLGYRTGLLGKYFNAYGQTLGEPPWPIPPGWSVWKVLVPPSPGGGYFTSFTNNESGQRIEYRDEDYHTDVIAGQAEQFIREQLGPWFLFVSPVAPHTPSPPARRHENVPVILGAWSPSFDEEDISDKPRWIHRFRRFDPARIAAAELLRTKRARAVMAVDEMIERLVRTLEKTGQLANTHIVFTSDNGYHFGEHRIPHGKQTPYDASIRVPLLWRGPGVSTGITRTLAVNVDLAPTFLHLAGGVRPTWMDGRYLSGALRGGGTGRRVVLLEHPVPSPLGVPRFYGLRTARYTYVYNYDTREQELYDHVTDPDEMTNVAGTNLCARAFRERARTLTKCAGARCRRLEAEPIRCGGGANP